MSNCTDLKTLLTALCTTYERDDAAPNAVHVTYRGDEVVHKQRVPRRQSDIAEDGLLDPGFGTGPVYYADLDGLEVRLADWRSSKGDAGVKDFSDVVGLMHGRSGLRVTDGAIVWSRVL